jgi:hypothetical protein
VQSIKPRYSFEQSIVLEHPSSILNTIYGISISTTCAFHP